MKTQDKNHGAHIQIKPITPIGVLIFVFRSTTFIMWVLALLAIIMAAIALFDLSGTSFLPLSQGVYFSGIKNSGVVHWTDSLVSNFSLRGVGTISISNPPNSLVFSKSLYLLLLSGATIASLRLTVQILRSVKQGVFLLEENAIRLRWIALIDISFIFFLKIFDIVSSTFFSNKLTYDSISFVNWNEFLFADFGMLLSSLFLLVIAEVFRVGAQVKQENDLTV